MVLEDIHYMVIYNNLKTELRRYWLETLKMNSLFKVQKINKDDGKTGYKNLFRSGNEDLQSTEYLKKISNHRLKSKSLLSIGMEFIGDKSLIVDRKFQTLTENAEYNLVRIPGRSCSDFLDEQKQKSWL